MTWRNIQEDLMQLQQRSREFLKPQGEHTNVHATEFTTKTSPTTASIIRVT
jgi:hypothetical protein